MFNCASKSIFQADNAKFTQIGASFAADNASIIIITFCLDVFLALLLALRFPFSRLDPVFPHGQGSVDPVQLEVEPTGVAHGLALVVPPPERGVGGPAVGAAQAHPPRGRGEHRGHVVHREPLHLQLGSDLSFVHD